jgi:hypothetical protein
MSTGQLIDPFPRPGKPVNRILSIDLPRNGKGGRALQHHEVVVRDDSPELTVVYHEQVVDLVAHHLYERLIAVIPGLGLDQRDAHNIPDPPSRVPVL